MSLCRNCNKYDVPYKYEHEPCIHCKSIKKFITDNDNKNIVFLIEYRQEMKEYTIWIVSGFNNVSDDYYYILCDINGSEFKLQPAASEIITEYFNPNDLLKISKEIPILLLLKRNNSTGRYRSTE